MPLDTDNVRDALKTRFPAISAGGFARSEIWNESPPDNYAIFGEVVRPYLLGLLRSHRDEAEMKNVFSFLEEIATGKSSALSDVLQIEILAPLSHTKAERGVALKYMGTGLRKLLREAEKGRLKLWLARLLAR